MFAGSSKYAPIITLARMAKVGWELSVGVRLICGDLSALPEAGAFLLAKLGIEALSELTLPVLAEFAAGLFSELTVEMALPALEAAKETWDDWSSVGQSAHEFGRLMGQLSHEFDKNRSPRTAAAMRSAQRAYDTFVMCDSSRDGFIQRSEYHTFCWQCVGAELPATLINKTFDDMDTNRDGEKIDLQPRTNYNINTTTNIIKKLLIIQ